MSERGDSGHIISPLPSALGAAALNPGLSEQLFAHEISRSPELYRAVADALEACEPALELMMSVHWVKANMRLRASRSDFDPQYVRSSPRRGVVKSLALIGAGPAPSYQKSSEFNPKSPPKLKAVSSAFTRVAACTLALPPIL